MKKTIQIAAMAALMLTAAACNESSTAADNSAMGNMSMPAGEKMANGIGKITAIDKSAGKVTLDHGPVSELKWPPMTMTFSGTPDMLAGLSVGDTVAFAFNWDGKAGQLTSIKKQ